MAIDFGKLGETSSADTVLPPRDVFAVLPSKDKKYNYLRDVQGEVLKEWFDHRRNETDLVLKMNTGSGKTVVGLLILKSCLNENKGPAVYISPDNYLVQQVMAEAKALGIDVTDSYKAPSFLRGRSILVTNIYTLINGKSAFGVADAGIRIQIGSVLIDDAHACLATAEGQFTLRMPSTSNVHAELFRLFRSELYRQSESGALEVEQQEPNKNMLVPYWAWIDKMREVAKILYDSRDDEGMTFQWPLIKDTLSLCNCVFGGGFVEISPKCLPVNVIPSFVMAERRLFMTATLCDDSILVTHFDVAPECIATAITPSSANDIGDRMILLPQELNPDITDEQLKAFFKELSRSHNVVVIVPSSFRATFWSDVVDITLTAGNLYDGVRRLKDGHVGLVVLVNKYDGIDLPDEACRILVVDGLPDVRRRIDKLEQAVLFGTGETANQWIQRIEQGMGRGVRSNEDHCVVFLMGRSLTGQLYAHAARKKFSAATQAQLSLSDRLADQLRGRGTEAMNEAIQRCLRRDTEWVKASKSVLVTLKYATGGTVSFVSLRRREAFNAAQRRAYPEACASIQEAINVTTDKPTKGWLMQQLAEYRYFIDQVDSQRILRAAVTENRLVTNPMDGIDYTRLSTPRMNQARQCAEFVAKFADPNGMLVAVNGLLDEVVFMPDTSSTFEESMKNLARFLGFNAQRPEAEFKKGPDVLWEIGVARYLVIECKNGATSENICKHDSDQLGGSMNWFIGKYGTGCSAVPVMVHPVNVFVHAATPHADTRIVTTEKLATLSSSIRGFTKAVASQKGGATSAIIAPLLVNYGLTADLFVERHTVAFRVKG